MARAIKFIEDYGRVLVVTPSEKKGGKPTKELVGGFEKGEVWPTCSNQLAQKLVNRKKVAEFVEEKAGDNLKKSHGALVQSSEDAKKIITEAEKKAKEILDAAEEKAKETLKAAENLAEGAKKGENLE